jgi:hypothetical protein
LILSRATAGSSRWSRSEPAVDDTARTEPGTASVDRDELVGGVQDHRAAGVAAADAAMGLAEDVLEEQEPVGEPVTDTAFAAGGISLHGPAALSREDATATLAPTIEVNGSSFRAPQR